MLMEAAPPGTDVSAIGSAMVAEPDVVEVHDLHVWTVTSGFPALSAHVVVGRAATGTACCAASSRCCTSASTSPHDAPDGRGAPAEGLIQVERAILAVTRDLGVVAEAAGAPTPR